MDQLITRKSCCFKLFQEIQPTSGFFDHIVNVGCPTKGGLDMNAKQFERGNTFNNASCCLNSGKVCWARGPRISSFVLEAFNCISFLSVQSSKLLKKFIILELEDFGFKTSDKVESSTYLYTGHPVVKSSVITNNDREPNQEPWGMPPFSSFHADKDWLAWTLCWRFDK